MLKVGGKYRHYKGNEYQIIAFAKHSETLEDTVVYQDLSDGEKVWVRPRKMFEEEVEVGGTMVPRFASIE
jgi:hypothetical protein